MELEDRFVLCPFPQYRDVPWDTVVEEDRAYVRWLVSGEGPDLEPAFYDFLTNLLEETPDE